MLIADRVIAMALVGLSVYFMIHATALPIGWAGATGPGGGAFPFWLSLVMLLASGGILVRSLRRGDLDGRTFFDRHMLRAVIVVAGSLIATIALIPLVGAYVAIPLFLVWYLGVYSRHSLLLTGSLTVATPVFLFFFFEVTLKILLPKGITEPLFFPLYAMFF